MAIDRGDDRLGGVLDSLEQLVDLHQHLFGFGRSIELHYGVDVRTGDEDHLPAASYDNSLDLVIPPGLLKGAPQVVYHGHRDHVHFGARHRFVNQPNACRLSSGDSVPGEDQFQRFGLAYESREPLGATEAGNYP